MNVATQFETIHSSEVLGGNFLEVLVNPALAQPCWSSPPSVNYKHLPTKPTNTSTNFTFNNRTINFTNMSSHAARGQEALAKSDYPSAIRHLTLALQDSPSPLWYTQRSTAYQRTSQHELALADADNAVLGAVSRSRREMIATAQFRRGVALYSLGRLGDARLCFNWARKYNEKEKGLTMWLGKVAKEYDAKGGEGAEGNETSVTEIPDKKKGEVKKVVKPKVAEATPTAAAPKSLTVTPKDKIRQEWYQTTNSVTIEVFAKGVPKDKAEVLIEEGSVSQTPLSLLGINEDETC